MRKKKKVAILALAILVGYALALLYSWRLRVVRVETRCAIRLMCRNRCSYIGEPLNYCERNCHRNGTVKCRWLPEFDWHYHLVPHN